LERHGYIGSGDHSPHAEVFRYRKASFIIADGRGAVLQARI